jgi:hypothetical protein
MTTSHPRQTHPRAVSDAAHHPHSCHRHHRTAGGPHHRHFVQYPKTAGPVACGTLPPPKNHNHYRLQSNLCLIHCLTVWTPQVLHGWCPS